MPIELQCGTCSGVFQAEQPGAIVACPHCGAHLQVPQFAVANPVEEAAALPAADNTSTMPIPAAEPEAPETCAPSIPTLSQLPPPRDPSTDLLPDQQPRPIEPPTEAIPQAELDRRLAEVAANEAVAHEAAGHEVEVDPNMSTLPHDAPEWGEAATQPGFTPTLAPPPHTATPTGPPSALEETAPFFTLGAPPVNPAPPAPREADSTQALPTQDLPVRTAASSRAAASPDAVEMVPKAWFQMVLSLTSALALTTLFLGYTVYKQTWTEHQLESLPDRAPPKPRGKNSKVTMIRVPFDAPMPARHTLHIGDSQRYGNLLVTVVGVTKGPIHFAHYDPTSKEVKPPSQPALKLHLKVENVGDEAFAPFDYDLIYGREPDPKNMDLIWANNFVSPANSKKKGPRVLMYDKSPSSAFDLAGQLCERELAPHEVVETYLATEETGWDALEGNLVWRIHFRKGHNAKTGNGVTTLIEVAFTPDQVEPDATQTVTPPPADAPATKTG